MTLLVALRTASLTALLSACGSAAPPARYDFGVPPPTDAAAAAPARGGELVGDVVVDAPAWLDTPALLYRLGYADDSQVHAYAQSQWVAAPARLVEQALRHAAAATAPACPESPADAASASAPQLAVELEEFSQVFDSQQSSRVVLRAHVRLLAPHGHELLAQRDFDLRTAAISPDAPGAAHGLRDLVGSFAGQALAWAGTQAHPLCGQAAGTLALPRSR